MDTVIVTTRVADDVEMAAWRAYAETVVDLIAALEADLGPHGLDLGDYQVLVHLSEAQDHEMRMCDLASQPAAVAEWPDPTARRAGPRRPGRAPRPSATDRRVMLAVLTDAGWEHLERVAPMHVDSVRRRVIDRLDEQRPHGDDTDLQAASGAGDCAPTTVTSPAAGVREPRRQRRHQGRHRRLRRARARPARRRGRRLHPQPLRRSQRRRSAASTSPTGVPGPSSWCPRTPTSPTGATAAPTPSRWSRAWPTRLGCAPNDVLVASTGVIGRRYPIDRLRAALAAMPCPPMARSTCRRWRGP